MDLRVGIGVDVHPFEKGRQLVLGGVKIPAEVGLSGHSDADALIHALIDALLGATSLGDIGVLFPDSDLRWKDIDSRIMLTEVMEKLHSFGWKVVNIDTSLLMEAPKLRPHVNAIKASLAQILAIDPSCVGVKASTAEKLGFVGRGEGVVAYCVALISKE